MSTGRRAYDILRGYVGREYERIRGLEEADAIAELDRPTYGLAPSPTVGTGAVSATPPDPKVLAGRILGVSPESGFLDVRKSYLRLIKRCDPEKFPEGSEERKQAGEIQRRIQWAYSALTESVDAIEKRFGSLEIE